MITAAEARNLLKVYEPIPVAHTSQSGKLLDDEGTEIDQRQTVPWVMALGPFGSWPTTLSDAEADFEEHAEWFTGRSIRVGFAVCYKQGWGYQADEEAAKN